MRLDDLLQLWAASERNSLSLGYPKEAAFAHEYQAGYRHSSIIPSEGEIEQLRVVESAINLLKKRSPPEPFEVLRQHYGAYMGAGEVEQRREAAIEKMGRSKYYRCLKSARDYLQGVLDSKTS
jgi:hypothetical protein